MVAKHIAGQGFKGIVNYNAKEQKGELIGQNFDADTTKEIITHFEETASLRSRVKVNAYHLSLALHTEDREVSNEEFKEIGELFLTKMRFANDEAGNPDFPYVIYRHIDADHQHIHFVFPRIDNNGKVINDKFSARRGMKVCAELEEMYDLKVTKNRKLGGKASKEDDFLLSRNKKANNNRNQIEKYLREHKEAKKPVSKKEAKQAMAKIRSNLKSKVDSVFGTYPKLDEALKGLERSGVVIEPRFSKTGKFTGIVFEDTKSGYSFKGSAIGWKAGEVQKKITSSSSNSETGFDQQSYKKVLVNIQAEAQQKAKGSEKLGQKKRITQTKRKF